MQRKLDERFFATAAHCAAQSVEFARKHYVLRKGLLRTATDSRSRSVYQPLRHRITYGARSVQYCIHARHTILRRNMEQCGVFGAEDPAVYLAILCVHELAHALEAMDPATYPANTRVMFGRVERIHHGKSHKAAMRALVASPQWTPLVRSMREHVRQVWPHAEDQALALAWTQSRPPRTTSHVVRFNGAEHVVLGTVAI